MTINIIIL